MEEADRAHWQAIVVLPDDQLDAHVAAVPTDAPLVAALRALRLARSTDERAAAIRDRDRVYRERHARAQRRLRAVQPAQRPTYRHVRPPGIDGPGRCPHGSLLEECDEPSCAIDIEAWTRTALGRFRREKWLRLRSRQASESDREAD